jgi:hypothetical protein
MSEMASIDAKRPWFEASYERHALSATTRVSFARSTQIDPYPENSPAAAARLGFLVLPAPIRRQGSAGTGRQTQLIGSLRSAFVCAEIHGRIRAEAAGAVWSKQTTNSMFHFSKVACQAVD